jgi:hypothetical protein
MLTSEEEALFFRNQPTQSPIWRLHLPNSEDGVVLRADDLRLKERVTIHVETLALLFSFWKQRGNASQYPTKQSND